MVILYKYIGPIITGLIISLVVAAPLMWLWNWLIPYLFCLPRINFGQAIGLFILSNILFKPTSTKQDND